MRCKRHIMSSWHRQAGCEPEGAKKARTARGQLDCAAAAAAVIHQINEDDTFPGLDAACECASCDTSRGARYETLSHSCVRPYTTTACGLKLLV
jgi:hypothetical protein